MGEKMTLINKETEDVPGQHGYFWLALCPNMCPTTTKSKSSSENEMKRWHFNPASTGTWLIIGIYNYSKKTSKTKWEPIHKNSLKFRPITHLPPHKTWREQTTCPTNRATANKKAAPAKPMITAPRNIRRSSLPFNATPMTFLFFWLVTIKLLVRLVTISSLKNI